MLTSSTGKKRQKHGEKIADDPKTKTWRFREFREKERRRILAAIML